MSKPHAAAVRAVVSAFYKGYISGTHLTELKAEISHEYTPLVEAMTNELDRWPEESFREIRKALRDVVGEGT